MDVPLTRLPADRVLQPMVGRVLIDDVLAQMHLGQAEVEKRVVILGTRMQLVTKYTSFIAVDPMSRVTGKELVLSANAPRVLPRKPFFGSGDGTIPTSALGSCMRSLG